MPRPLALSLLLCPLLAVGCVQRTISVITDPPGALVTVNDVEVGRTPVEVPFRYYGTYDVRLEKAGYATVTDTARAKAPWWEYPGPDLLAEAIPGGKSKVVWYFELVPETPAEDVSVERLEEHARQMRALTRQPLDR